MAEMFCLDCEIEIKLPSGFISFVSDNSEEKPTKFKDGYRCADCTRKRKNKGEKK